MATKPVATAVFEGDLSRRTAAGTNRPAAERAYVPLPQSFQQHRAFRATRQSPPSERRQARQLRAFTMGGCIAHRTAAPRLVDVHDQLERHTCVQRIVGLCAIRDQARASCSMRSWRDESDNADSRT
jgi:hypothetical protein